MTGEPFSALLINAIIMKTQEIHTDKCNLLKHVLNPMASKLFNQFYLQISIDCDQR